MNPREGTNPSAHTGTPLSPAAKVELIRATLAEHRLTQLVETGLYAGHGSGMDIPAELLSFYAVIDYQRANVDEALERGYIALQGDSAELVPELCRFLQGPALWWLDAHAISDDEGAPPCPLELELAAILRRGFPDAILVDDVRMLGERDWPSLERLAEVAADATPREHFWHVADDILRITPAWPA